MAPPKKPKEVPTSGLLAPVTEKDLAEFTFAAMKTYGTDTNEDRAIPALQDGLKPVARRAMWAARTVAMKQTKAARLVGEMLGKFHPHGDEAAFGALVTQAVAPTPIFYGEGNWGTPTDGPAAMRYIELYVSRYGEQMLHPDYLKVTPMVPNYDDKDVEPAYLPSLLPNILLNDSMGIGVALKTRIPMFTPPSLLGVMVRLLDGEQLSPADYARALKMHEPYGGVVTKTRANFAAMVALMTVPDSTISFDSVLEVNRDEKTMAVVGFAPDFNNERFIEDARAIPGVQSAYAAKTTGSKTGARKAAITVVVKKTVNYNDFDKIVARVHTLAQTKIRYSIYVSSRSVPEGSKKTEVKFSRMSVPEVIVAWLKFRIRLERDCITYRIKRTEEKIERLNLMVFAADNRKVIFDSLDKKDPAQYIATHLKIELEVANAILDLQVRRLTGLDRTKLSLQIKDLEAYIVKMKKLFKTPAVPVRAYLLACIEAFNCSDKRWPGCQQFWLDLPRTSTAEEAV